MKLSGQRGEILISNRVAATLGKWGCERDPGAKEIEIEAQLVEQNEFLIKRSPLKIRLDLQKHKRRAVSGVRIEDSTIFVTATW